MYREATAKNKWYSSKMNLVKRTPATALHRNVSILGVLFAGATLAFGIITGRVVNGATDAFDETALLWINQQASHTFDTFFVAVTQLGDVVVIPLVSLLLVGVFLAKKRPLKALFVAIAMGGAMLLNVLLKSVIDRSRPDLWEWIIHETSLSFPSGHATASMALALMVMMLFWRTKWRLWLAIVGPLYVVLVGVSRLYLGVHYPTDILGGWLLSAAWVSLIAMGYVYLVNYQSKAKS